jgi:hypothetical protein
MRNLRFVRFVLGVDDLEGQICGLCQRNGRAFDGQTEEDCEQLTLYSDLGCLVGLNVYTAFIVKYNYANDEDDDVNIASCNTHKKYTCIYVCVYIVYVCVYIYIIYEF